MMHRIIVSKTEADAIRKNVGNFIDNNPYLTTAECEKILDQWVDQYVDRWLVALEKLLWKLYFQRALARMQEVDQCIAS